MEISRGSWGTRMGFVLAAAGSAVGLGNLWKFPYIAWVNEGGGFVLIYLACIAAVGLPIMLAEILIGRRTRLAAVGGLGAAAGRRWRLVGGLGVATGFVLLSYYAVIAGWSFAYMARCLQWSVGGYPNGYDGVAAFGALAANGWVQVALTALFLVATASIVYRGVGAGIERAARVMMPALFVILLLLLVSAMTMDGAGQALSFLLAPRFDHVRAVSVLEALGHSFFTLSLGMGTMITYGSYLGRRESIVRTSMVVVVLDTIIALLASLTMFAVIFSIPGLSDRLGASAVGMLFVTLPELFYTVVPAGALLAPLFYLLVMFAALTSSISLLEVVVAYLIDERGMQRKPATLTSIVAVGGLAMLCAVSLGAWGAASNFELFAGKLGVLSTLDHLVSNGLLPLGGLGITLAAGWFMTRKATEEELSVGAPGWFRYSVWRFFIRFVSPAAVAAILVAVIFFGRDFS